MAVFFNHKGHGGVHSNTEEWTNGDTTCLPAGRFTTDDSRLTTHISQPAYLHADSHYDLVFNSPNFTFPASMTCFWVSWFFLLFSSCSCSSSIFLVSVTSSSCSLVYFVSAALRDDSWAEISRPNLNDATFVVKPLRNCVADSNIFGSVSDETNVSPLAMSIVMTD